MNDLTPHEPSRPLVWPDIVTELQQLLLNIPEAVYIVGGAVRDALLRRPFHDLDLATPGNAVDIARQIANHFGGGFFVLDSERGVGRALLDRPDGRMIIDVAQFRGSTIIDDLKDRDFTINAMAVDLKNDINLLLDPLSGETDISRKQIRRCAPYSITADPVRALRAVRQSVQFGMRIEPGTLRDIRAEVPHLASVSPERIRDELFKLLALPRPAAAARVADTLGLLTAILPEIEPLHNLEQPPPHVFDGWQHTLLVMENLAGTLATISYTRTDHTAASFSFGLIAMQLDRYREQLQAHIRKLWPNDRSHQALLMLTALLHDIGKPIAPSAYEVVGSKMASARAEALRLSNGERQLVAAIILEQTLPQPSEELTPLSIHRFWRRLGEAGIDVCLFALADHLGTYGPQLKQDHWLMLVERVHLLLDAWFEKYNQLVSPPVMLDGNQLASLLELQPGPIIGQLLDMIREAQVEGRVHTPQEAISLARLFLENQES
jgi:tRNA nucleotidyltransferase/poly(A) polymerase